MTIDHLRPDPLYLFCDGKHSAGWRAADRARESALGANTVRRAEVAVEETSLTAANELAIRRALEAAGRRFH